jgi:hypothetical protein
MKGDVRTAARVVQQASDYGTSPRKPLGFSLKKSKPNEMLAVMRQFVDGFMHIGQRGVLLLLLEVGVDLGLPAA